MDRVTGFIPHGAGKVRVKFNQGHVAVGTTGTNFCWFHPRRSPRLHMIVWLGDDRDAFIKKFKGKGIEARPHYDESVTLKLTMQEVEKNKALLKQVLKESEQRSR
jgi:uncharacterized protein YacL (UPF0231 family)